VFQLTGNNTVEIDVSDIFIDFINIANGSIATIIIGAIRNGGYSGNIKSLYTYPYEVSDQIKTYAQFEGVMLHWYSAYDCIKIVQRKKPMIRWSIYCMVSPNYTDPNDNSSSLGKIGPGSRTEGYIATAVDGDISIKQY
jgi:hypothetical protein